MLCFAVLLYGLVYTLFVLLSNHSWPSSLVKVHVAHLSNNARSKYWQGFASGSLEPTLSAIMSKGRTHNTCELEHTYMVDVSKLCNSNVKHNDRNVRSGTNSLRPLAEHNIIWILSIIRQAQHISTRSQLHSYVLHVITVFATLQGSHMFPLRACCEQRFMPTVTLAACCLLMLLAACF